MQVTSIAVLLGCLIPLDLSPKPGGVSPSQREPPDSAPWQGWLYLGWKPLGINSAQWFHWHPFIRVLSRWRSLPWVPSAASSPTAGTQEG